MMRTVVIGGTSGIGLEVARARAARGDEVVLTGRDPDRAAEVAASVGGVGRPASRWTSTTRTGWPTRWPASGRWTGWSWPPSSATRTPSPTYDVDRATKLAVLKLVGYTEVIHTLLPRMNAESSVVLFGGRAKDRPYPGSITVSTVNGGVVGLVNALALEMAPIRVNALHPGIVGDSPFWVGQAASRARRLPVTLTPTGRLAIHGRTSWTRWTSCWRTAASTPSTFTSTAGGWSRDSTLHPGRDRRHRPDGCGDGRPGRRRRAPADGLEPDPRDAPRRWPPSSRASRVADDRPRGGGGRRRRDRVARRRRGRAGGVPRRRTGWSPACGPGTVVADTSTVAPETIRALRRRGRARPGRRWSTPRCPAASRASRAAPILVMAGGDADAVERARPALESFAQRIILLGPLGSGLDHEARGQRDGLRAQPDPRRGAGARREGRRRARAGLRGDREQCGRGPLRELQAGRVRTARIGAGGVRPGAGGQGPGSRSRPCGRCGGTGAAAARQPAGGRGRARGRAG